MKRTQIKIQEVCLYWLRKYHFHDLLNSDELSFIDHRAWYDLDNVPIAIKENLYKEPALRDQWTPKWGWWLSLKYSNENLMQRFPFTEKEIRAIIYLDKE